MKKRIITIIMMFALAFTVVPQLAGNADVYASGSKTKKMTVYSVLVKKGNVVCVNYDSIVLAAVNIKTNKTRIITKAKRDEFGENIPHYYPTAMKIKGNFLYFVSRGSFGDDLYRANVKTGKIKRLAGIKGAQNWNKYANYAISGKKIYLKQEKGGENKKGFYTTKSRNIVMKLNGKSKKKTSVKAKSRIKKTNAKKYKVVRKIDHKGKVWTVIDYDDVKDQDIMGWVDTTYYNLYLKKPNGKLIFITSYTEISD